MRSWDVSEPDKVSVVTSEAPVVLRRILGATIFEAVANETLGIVADAEEFAVGKPPVNFAEGKRSVLSANPGVGACLKIT